MRQHVNVIASIMAMLLSVTAFALVCPNPREPVWNPAEGTCVQGVLVRYCQDTELQTDGSCGLPDGASYRCANYEAQKDKQIYAPMYEGQCSLDGESNPCVNVTEPPITQISYHDPALTGTPCPDL